MTDYFYNAQASGSNNGSSKTDAYTSIATALAALTSNGDRLFIADASTENLGATLTWTPTVDCSLLVIDFATDLLSDMYAAGGYIGSSSAFRSIAFAGNTRLYTRGLCLRGEGTGSTQFSIGQSTGGADHQHDNFTALLGTGGAQMLRIGTSNAIASSAVRFKNLKLRIGNAAQRIEGYGAKLEVDGLDFTSDSGTSLNGVYSAVKAGAAAEISNYNVSRFTTACSLVAADSICSPGMIRFNNGTHVSGLTIRAATTPATLASSEVWVNDSSENDVHTRAQYHNAYGYMATTLVRYADGNISGNVGWRVITSAECNAQNPFYTPWIDWPNDATSAITPYIEVARDFSATPFTDAQIWLEVQAKTTSGSTILTTYTDRVALLGTPADQASSGLSWAGLNSPNNKMQLAISSITPAEVGAIRYRVGVAIASENFIFIDPQLRT